MGAGEIRRSPSEGCADRVTPASTFKIPHALAALDAGVLESSESVLSYDRSEQPFDAWKKDHTLASAMHYSVVWYFQRIAEMLGPEREADYLRRFEYGNEDASSGLTTFWLGGSLLVSPEEQVRFLVRLYRDELPTSAVAMEAVRRMLVQPRGVVRNALGDHPFGTSRPADCVLSAKTGSASPAGARSVRWLVGHVKCSDRSWVFVSSVTGEELPATAAMDLAERSLVDAGVFGAR
jgi:beta-lactamase class D